VVFHQILEKQKVVHEYHVGGNGAHDWATRRHLLCARLLPGLWRAKR
jgi:enterochelin esterase family protein